MIKKIAILFALAIAAISASAQLPVGGWTIHSPFNGVSSIVETKNQTFYLSSGSLFSYDKTTQEVRSLNVTNDLNGGVISNIYAEPSGKYILIVYDDNNIDRINSDGSVTNISDICDALLTGTPTINHIGFGKNKFYVATSFGLVTFNANKNETIETMFSPKAVDKVIGVGDNVVIVYDGELRAASQNTHLISIDLFKKLSNSDNPTWTFGSLTGSIGDNRILFQNVSGSNSQIVVGDIDFNANTITYDTSMPLTTTSKVKIVPMGADEVFTTNETTIYTYGATGSASTSTYPTALAGYALSALNGMSNVWAGNSNGISLYDLSDVANPVQKMTPFGSVDFATVGCNRIFAQDSGDLLFWNATADCGYQFGYSGTANLTLTSYNNNNDGFSKVATDIAVTQPTWITEDPNDPNILYVGSFNKGVYRFENGVKTLLIDNSNSPLVKWWNAYYYPAYIGFDQFNNFWILQEDPYLQGNNNNIFVISYENLNKGTISKSDWTSMANANLYRCTIANILKENNIIVFSKAYWSKNLTFVKQNNTSSTDDDEIITVNTFIDQDNKTFSYSHVMALTEDANGKLWVGTNKGVYEITDPNQITSSTAYINHLKVPRNDGTGLADYLLDATPVSGIAVDSSNRKWISTTTDGVYLVSEDGDEILEHYTSTNSMLPNDCVFSVACDPNSSSVFFATSAGVAEYNSTSTPASDDLSNVYAFPNPVRPDYTGWITVTGLMDNTLVKIADAAGNVLFQGRSEGGMITWDGCNTNGDRVKTGVYFVFASNGTSLDSNSESCVTKIMVIN